MEQLHQADYSFPEAKEWIDNAPEEQDIDRVLDEMVEKAGEGGLTDLFNTIHSELDQSNIYVPGYDRNINTTDNRRDFVSGKDSTYAIQHDVVYRYRNNEVGKTSINIFFQSSSIILTYKSKVQGFQETYPSHTQIYNLGDIREVLESQLQPIREISA